MAGETILVVDDDNDIREIITLYLEKEGYQVITASDGRQAITYAFSINPDLIILDMMLPVLDGIEVCQALRKELSVPILFLSCKSSPSDKSIGLIAGGDDYMSKPFDTMELLARVKAHLRRNRILENANDTNAKNNLLCYPNLSIDLYSHSVAANGQEVVLSPKEFQLLVLLAKNPNVVFSNEHLFESLWGAGTFGDHRTVMVHISNIRKKIEKDAKNPIFIQTVKGAGYKFCLVSE
ncbi:DNA-binding response regulator, OmpR family, contains REC and winged-helix (wHTH) domain [Natronincola peptidivorans]|uniref:Stage 0 sporulation protein A homolog n=1 Tax=Natronincola peptidivorans TaxID=426128 RepID=A0A1I0CFQ2_9FIRM|nr:response regulator transcription factor [Natronincola peptidivorans]SET17952.1 DNA-binding response regulator, OmpR family, contains REC and winged-helix (wHTH) domain [Natronincola peptidivorans]